MATAIGVVAAPGLVDLAGRSGRGRMMPESGEPTFDVASAWQDHGAALLGFAVNSLGDRATAEDCVQETYLRAWRARASYSARQGSERTWLFAIARNVVTDAARARARRPVPIDDDGLARLGPAAADEAGRPQDQVDDRVTLVAAMARLSDAHRQVLVAVQLQGRSYADLAAATGVPVATLRTRAYHALRALRALLREEDPDD